MEADTEQTRGRRIGGWIGGVLVAGPAAYLAWIGVLFSFLGSEGTRYPWAGMLVVLVTCAAIIGAAILAGCEIGASIACPGSTRQFYLSSSGLQLDALSNERLLTLWHTIAGGQVPPKIPSHRVAALRQAIRRTADQRGLQL